VHHCRLRSIRQQLNPSDRQSQFQLFGKMSPQVTEIQQNHFFKQAESPWPLKLECPVSGHWPMNEGESKVIQVTGRGGLQVCDSPRFSHFLGSRLRDGAEFASPVRWHARLYLPRTLLVLVLLQAEPKGLSQLKNPIGSSRIEPAILRLQLTIPPRTTDQWWISFEMLNTNRNPSNLSGAR
jgi:hypothetical protein